MRRFLSLILLTINFQAVYSQSAKVKNEFRFAADQTEYMIGLINKTDTDNAEVSPRTIENGKLKLVGSGDWTSGFFPGELWYLYEFTGEKKWLNNARFFTEKLEKQQFNKGTHDLGFIIYCSYGNGYRLTKDEHYRQVIINAAKSLSTRFNPQVGAIKSWDHRSDLWKYPVIIDNMMNLELLFEATKLSGDSSFYKLAVSHANKTLKNHFRDDYSSYHVVDYDPMSGKVLKKQTHQGYANESAWARGQAWALYGFTLSYRETKDTAYLEQAKRIASFILNHPRLPRDKVPYWDFDDPAIPNTSRDASAAAIIASALYELSGYTHSKIYKESADSILKSLTRHYRSKHGENGGFILKHSTGHRPYNGEVDVPLIYADYYYLEALLRSRRY